MARKKLTHHSQQHPKQEKPQDPMTQQQPSMEDPQDKLHNLKSLNAMLLKETIERRQQAESLQLAKEGLEFELAQTATEKIEMEAELARATEERVCLEVEKSLFCVFLNTKMNEVGVSVDGLVRALEQKESGIGLLNTQLNRLMVNLQSDGEKLSQACRERDLSRAGLDNLRKEANGLKKRVIEMEEKESRTEEEIMKLNSNLAQLAKKNKETEKEIMGARESRDLAEKKLAQNVKELECLKREMEDNLKNKNEIEAEKGEQKVKIGELEKHISELNEIKSRLQRERSVSLEKVSELEKCCSEAMEKGKIIQMEVDAMVEEKIVKETTIERLMEEIDTSGKRIKALNSEKNDKEQMIEKLIREKNEIEGIKVCKENEVVELLKELGGLKDAVFAMQQTIKAQEEKNKELSSEVGYYRDAFEQVKLEKDNAQTDLDEEKKNGSNLTSKILEMEKKIEEDLGELSRMNSECDNLHKERKELECQANLLGKEKELVQKNLLEAKLEIDELRTKIGSSEVDSDRALAMLKNTAVLLSGDGKEQVLINGKEPEPYVTELEVIRKAFRNKDTIVEEMKQQLKFLQTCVADGQKKNGLWALFSSAITVLAAASVAYIARIR